MGVIVLTLLGIILVTGGNYELKEKCLKEVKEGVAQDIKECTTYYRNLHK